MSEALDQSIPDEEERRTQLANDLRDAIDLGEGEWIRQTLEEMHPADASASPVREVQQRWTWLHLSSLKQSACRDTSPIAFDDPEAADHLKPRTARMIPQEIQER